MRPIDHARPPSELIEALVGSLRAHAPITTTTEPTLAAAIRAALEPQGQLVRAQLVFRGCQAQALSEAKALALATAVEYFHLASLLYDDLPCMDNSIERRGQPCLHRTYGEATTILVALALINRAYALIHGVLCDLPAGIQVEARDCLEAAMGTTGIIGGQARDLGYATGVHSKREVLRIARKKTGALFLLSIYFPALLGQPNVNERRALRALCLYWGLGYQVIDDLNDVLSNPVETGKTSGRDQFLTRPNLALAIGIPDAHRQLARVFNLSIRALKQLEGKARWGYLAEFHHTYFEAAARRKGLFGARSAA